MLDINKLEKLANDAITRIDAIIRIEQNPSFNNDLVRAQCTIIQTFIQAQVAQATVASVASMIAEMK